ncbi:MAG TPA: GNAT family N-acetyltransferase [Candidatus Baltobacteraceae bacterium]|nr:GNAT family N-acetyltransferase [Candidatus Baltobacteraceae bacterium]
METILETQRLILRTWSDADVEPFADMMSDPHVMRYYARPMDRGRAVEVAQTMRERLEANRYGRFVMQIKGDDRYAGMMVLDDIRYDVPFEPRREVGWILPEFTWGHGYAPEAASALLDYAFTNLEWPEVIAMAVTHNHPSQRVMQKIGMVRDTSVNFEMPTMPGCAPQPFVLYRSRCDRRPMEA